MTTVLGGGLSGLSAGYYMLKRFGQPLTIFESTNRLGGWIRTEQHKDKGFTFEAGPRTIRPKGIPGANTLQLLTDLQIPIDVIPADHAAARNRLIYNKGKLYPLPNTVGSIFKTLPPFSRPLIIALLSDLTARSKKVKLGDESIYDFAQRRFGQEVADLVISPLICGICAGDAKEISVRFLMNDIFEKEQRWGGVLKGMLISKFTRKDNLETGAGIFADQYPKLYLRAQSEKWSMYRLKEGLETLPKKLVDHLRDHNVNIQTSAECKRIIFKESGGLKLCVKGQELETEHIICALPSYKLAECVKSQHPSLAGQLLTIPYVDVAVINLQYSSKLLKEEAFGFLVPPMEKLPILGITFDSCCFNMDENTVLTVMMGGKWFADNFGNNPTQKELLDTALQHVDKILHINFEPKHSRVHILPKCIPQYTVGHKERIENIRRYIKNYKLPLSLCGAAYDGVGINDVIMSARNQVNQLEN